MDQISSANSHDLLTCFFEECENQFRFLEEKHGYLYLSGLAEYKNNYKIIKPYTGKADIKHAPSFLATTRYEKHDHAVEISYGDKNYAIEAFIYPDAMTRLSLRDIMLALRSDFAKPKNLSYLTETTQLFEALDWFARLLKEHPKILNPSEKLIDRTLTMHSKLTEQGIRAHFQSLLKAATVRAAEAFLKKSYEQVIEILLPFESYLSPSDLKKLKIARSKLS